MSGAAPVRVLRIVARLNVGGPAHHVTLLSAGLDPERYATLLLTGETGHGEGSFEHLAEQRGVRLRRVPGLGPALRPRDDLRALLALVREVRRFRPDIVHTHTAKAGLLGRVAARLALGRRPIVVHTYHGHVLSGYFSPRTTAFYRGLERALGRLSTRLIGVSRATVDELVELGVARRERFSVVPIGLELDAFLRVEPGTGPWRAELDAGPDALVLAFVGRLVPIKRVDLLIEGVRSARARGVDVRLAVVGDGELRTVLQEQAAPLGDAVRFLGFRSDLAAIAAGTDVAVLGSDNEGTPVALIEAAAAGVPAIATDVGGVRDIVVDGVSGFVVRPGDVAALTDAIQAADAQRSELRAMGRAARAHVRDRFAAPRLIADVTDLYDELLREHGRGGSVVVHPSTAQDPNVPSEDTSST
ncbi:MAG: glycosyltransferase [Patulibacter sp.]